MQIVDYNIIKPHMKILLLSSDLTVYKKLLNSYQAKCKCSKCTFTTIIFAAVKPDKLQFFNISLGNPTNHDCKNKTPELFCAGSAEKFQDVRKVTNTTISIDPHRINFYSLKLGRFWRANSVPI